MFYYLAHSGFSQWQRPKIPHQSLERVLEPFHLEDEVVFRFPGRVKPEHAKVIRVRKDQDTGERMYDVEPEDEKQRMKTPVRSRVGLVAVARGRDSDRAVASMASGAHAVDATLS